MATISAKDVAELRQRTGAGMMDCKKALEENGGDMEKAIEYLRKKGIAKAEKRAGRDAAEGLVFTTVSADAKTGAMVELNCETDFVARNPEFSKLGESVLATVLADAKLNGMQHVGTDGAYLSTAHGGSTLGEAVKHQSGTTGENIQVRRVARFTTDGALGLYKHHNGKVAVLVEVTGATGDAATTLAKTVAEHAAAGVPTVPVAVSRDGVPTDVVDRERRIAQEQAEQSGKPANIVQKMVEGRVDKYFKEVTLLEQPWVRDDSKTIGDVVKGTAGAQVARFARFQVGGE